MRKKIENLQYLVLVLFILAQCVIGPVYLLGQGLYLVGNGIMVCRAFYLRRPVSEKISNLCFFGLTLGLIFIRLLT